MMSSFVGPSASGVAGGGGFGSGNVSPPRFAMDSVGNPGSSLGMGAFGPGGDTISYPAEQPWNVLQQQGDRQQPTAYYPTAYGYPPVDRNSSATFEQLATYGLGAAKLASEYLVSHPCVVLRRQAQIHARARSFHTQPFTLVPVIYNLQQNQGIKCLWKGLSSCCVVELMTYATESVLSDIFGLPSTVGQVNTIQKMINHILLKSLSFGLTTPFVLASLVETVQSDLCKDAGDGWLQWVREAVGRLLTDVRQVSSTVVGERRLSVLALTPATVIHRLAHYALSGVAQQAFFRLVRNRTLRKAPRDRTVFDDFYPDLFASFASRLSADALLFPLETALLRLYLQGTRTIIDDLDVGTRVIPLFGFGYTGLLNAFSTIYEQEGLLGFYKGFGALVLQYLLCFMVLRVTGAVFEQLEEIFVRSRPSLGVPPPSAGVGMGHPPGGVSIAPTGGGMTPGVNIGSAGVGIDGAPISTPTGPPAGFYSPPMDISKDTTPGGSFQPSVRHRAFSPPGRQPLL